MAAATTSNNNSGSEKVRINEINISKAFCNICLLYYNIHMLLWALMMNAYL